MHCPSLRLSLYAACLLAALALCLPAPAQAATLTVPAQYPTIGAAVAAAASGDTVLVADGTYSGPGNRDIDFGGKSLTVASQNGAARTIIDCGGGYVSNDGSGNHRGFYLHSGEQDATISGFTVKDAYEYGNADQGLPAHPNDGTGGGILISHTSVGTVTVTGCAIVGNYAQYEGGGVDISSSNGGAVIVTNCTVAKNTTWYYGGGVRNFNSGGTITITNCTISTNSGGDVYNSNSSGTIALTNDVVYGATSGEIVNDPNSISNATATHCDVQGGYAGTGNINADPLFVYPPADLHLKPGSPCLGAGTSTGAPATDKDGNTRPNPPSIGAYEIAPAGTTHILWDNTDGRMSLWDYSTASGSETYHIYGPYTGWAAKAVADGGADGRQRVLWDNTDGRMSLWSLDNGAARFTQYTFGPYAGWTAKAVSAGTDNTTRVLWGNTDGRASVWNYDTGGGSFTQKTYGPYAGWSARAIADGADGRQRVLWDNADGRMSLWSLDNNAGALTQQTFGPYAGWTAGDVSSGY